MTKLSLIFQGPCASRSGYGDHARSIVQSLMKLQDKFDIKIIPTKWGNCPQNQLTPNTELGKFIFENIVYNLDKKPNVYIQMTVANEFQPMGDFNIGITAGVETTLTPQSFIEGANRMDLILTPSEFTKKGFDNTVFNQIDNRTNQKIGELKTIKPVEVLLEGIDTDVFNSTPKTESPISNIQTPFLFLMMGHWLTGEIGHDRKDIGMLIKTFCNVFKSTPKEKQPGLVLKTSMAGFSMIEREDIRNRILTVTHEFGEKCPPIYLLFGDLSPDEINSLYNDDKIKAMVMFTKGEGYGRPLAEFATTGKPILVSEWSGHMDFLPHDNTVYLSGELADVHPTAQNDFLIKGSKWFTVNYSKAAQKIHDVWSNYSSYKTKSEPLKNHISTKFDMNAQDEQLKLILDKWVKVKQKVELVLPQISKL